VKLLLAPDKFKGSLSSAAAAQALGAGWKSVLPDTELLMAPIADGGEGFSETLCTALHGEWIQVDSVDALGRPIACRIAWVPESRTAIFEMSEASGLHRLLHSERDPRKANTYGTGLMIRDAIMFGAKRILLGIGGSATTDGGLGMAAALGYRFLSASGEPVEPIPANFPQIVKIDASEALVIPELIAACDVQNPLLGERGTAAVFGPQKGADEAAVRFLEGVCPTSRRSSRRNSTASFATRQARAPRAAWVSAYWPFARPRCNRASTSSQMLWTSTSCSQKRTSFSLEKALSTLRRWMAKDRLESPPAHARRVSQSWSSPHSWKKILRSTHNSTRFFPSSTASFHSTKLARKPPPFSKGQQHAPPA